MSDSIILNKILWMKALWKSFLALITGFAFYMLPGLFIGFKMGSELSTKISEVISVMYQENVWINISFIVLTSLLIFWYSRKISKGTGDKKKINGLLVGSLPALIGLVSILMIKINIFFIAMILLSLGSGLIGSVIKEKKAT